MSSEDEIARYYWPKESQPDEEPAGWFRAAISDAFDSGIAFAVRRSASGDGNQPPSGVREDPVAPRTVDVPHAPESSEFAGLPTERHGFAGVPESHQPSNLPSSCSAPLTPSSDLRWQPIATLDDPDREVLMWTPPERIYTKEQLRDLPYLRESSEQRVATRRMWTWATHWMPLLDPPALAALDPGDPR